MAKKHDQQSDQIETDLIVAKQRNGPIGKPRSGSRVANAKFVNMDRRERTS